MLFQVILLPCDPDIPLENSSIDKQGCPLLGSDIFNGPISYLCFHFQVALPMALYVLRTLCTTAIPVKMEANDRKTPKIVDEGEHQYYWGALAPQMIWQWHMCQ